MKGYTLFEILIVLLIGAVLATIAIPGFRYWQQRQQADHAIRQIAYAVQFARINALTHAQQTVLCPSVDGKNCDANWCGSYMVALANEDDSPAKPLRIFSATKHGCLKWKGFPARAYLVFNTLGYSNEQNGRFSYCPSYLTKCSRSLIINRLGRSRIVKS